MKAFRSTLEQVGRHVLEEWAMMLVDIDLPGPAGFDPGAPFYLVRANYRGVFDGTLSVLCQAGFLNTLGLNLCGVDEPISPGERLDSLKELTNVISGNFLVEAFGEETVFDLPAFELLTVGQEGAAEILGREPVWCLGDGEPVAIDFTIRG